MSEFAAALDAAMSRRRIGAQAVAHAVGVSKNSVIGYRVGSWEPSVEIADRIAAVLDAPELRRIAAARHRGICAVCGRPFRRGSVDTATCGRRCRDDHRIKGLAWRNPLPDRQVAINAMCAACEPEGICRVEDCPLRPFSPLPLVSPAAAMQ